MLNIGKFSQQHNSKNRIPGWVFAIPAFAAEGHRPLSGFPQAAGIQGLGRMGACHGMACPICVACHTMAPYLQGNSGGFTGFRDNFAEGTQHGYRAGHDPGESLPSRGIAPAGPCGTGRIGPVRGSVVEGKLFFGRGFAIVVVPAKFFAVAGFHQQVFMGTTLDHGLFTAGSFADKGGFPGCGCLANIDISISVHHLLLSPSIHT
jgi:hypothetical protein